MSIRLARIEIWSDLEAAGGGRLAFEPKAIAAEDVQSIDAGASLTLTIPMSGPAYAEVDRRRVVRVVLTDGTWQEWRIIRTEDGQQKGNARTADIHCESPLSDLADRVATRVEANGLVSHDFGLSGVTPEVALGFILDQAPAYFTAGDVEATEVVDLTFSWDSPLAALQQLLELTATDLELERGEDGYIIHLRDPSTLVTGARLRYRKNILGIRRTQDLVPLITRAYPQGAAEDGFHADMSSAAWKVAAVSGSQIDLDGDPIAIDDQLNGLYLQPAAGGTPIVISDTFLATQRVILASPLAIAPGARVHVRSSVDGAGLTYLDNPAARARYLPAGEHKARVIELPNIPDVQNLIENPFLDIWSGDLPVGWNLVGAPDVDDEASQLYRRHGAFSAHVDAAEDEGIETDWTPIIPGEISPYFSAQIALFVAAGRVRFELVAQTPAGEITFPSSETAYTSVVGAWVENLAIAGIELLDIGATQVKLRILAHQGDADFYLDAAQLTQTAGGATTLYAGRSANDLWYEANRALLEHAEVEETYRVDVADLQRLNPSAYSGDVLRLSTVVSVDYDDLGISVLTRVVEVRRDLLVPGAVSVTLANRVPGILGQLTGSARRDRQNPSTYVPPPIDPAEYALEEIEFRGPTVGGLRLYKVFKRPRILEVHIFYKLFEGDLPEDWVAQVLTVGNLHKTVTTDGEEFTTPQPATGQILMGLGVPWHREGGRFVKGDGVEFKADGTEPIIRPTAPKFVESADGTQSTLSFGIEDPRGVVSGAQVFITNPGVAEAGPFAMALAGGIWSYTFPLYPDHAVTIRALINRNDGGAPLAHGPWTADTNKVPGIPFAREQERNDDEVIVYVDNRDTDTVSQWYREVIGGTPGDEVEITPRSLDPRFGTFTVTADPDGDRRFRVYSKNSAVVVGDYFDLRIAPYNPALELEQLDEAVDDLEALIEASVEGGIDAEEAARIAEQIRLIEGERADVNAQYADTAANPDLIGAPLTNLTSAHTALNTAIDSLIDTIQDAISDSVVDAGELAAIDAVFATWESARALYRTRHGEAIEAIKNKGLDDVSAYAELLAAANTAAIAGLEGIVDGKVTTFFSSSAPTADGVGDLWFDTDDGNKLYRASAAGSGSWVEVQDQEIAAAILAAATAQETADGKIVTFYQSSPPTAEGVGDLWVDTDDRNKLYRWSGSAWNEVLTQGITKKIFIPFTEFRGVAPSDDFQINLDSSVPSNMGPASSGTKHFMASVVLPPGVILRWSRLHSYRNSGADTVNYHVFAIDFNSAPRSLFGLLNHATTGWSAVENPSMLSETVANGTFYMVRGFLTEASTRDNATVRGIELEYETDAFVKSY